MRTSMIWKVAAGATILLLCAGTAYAFTQMSKDKTPLRSEDMVMGPEGKTAWKRDSGEASADDSGTHGGGPAVAQANEPIRAASIAA